MKLTNYLREAFVRAAMDDVPAVDYKEQMRIVINKKIERLQKIAGVTSIDYTRLSLRYIYIDGTSYMGAGLTESELTQIKDSPEVQKLIVLNTEQKTKLRALSSKLEGVIKGCNTRKQAAEALPEFDKYLPPEDAKAINTLPALANVMSDFVKAGWPKNQKRIAS